MKHPVLQRNGIDHILVLPHLRTHLEACHELKDTVAQAHSGNTYRMSPEAWEWYRAMQSELGMTLFHFTLAADR